jgi:zinc D-Ala-D-Ala carboxypeptidase
MRPLRYFKLSEFDCKETGENAMKESFLYRIDELRHKCGFPFVILSGYRSPRHSLESRKKEPGAHSRGVAVDILCRGPHMRKLVIEAHKMGFTGIGVNNGSVHIDDDIRLYNTLWGYGDAP